MLMVILLAVLAVAAVYAIGVYNGLVRLREGVKQAWSNIDVILDKISRSGYESLSKTEKDILFKASNDGKR